MKKGNSVFVIGKPNPALVCLVGKKSHRYRGECEYTWRQFLCRFYICRTGSTLALALHWTRLQNDPQRQKRHFFDTWGILKPAEATGGHTRPHQTTESLPVVSGPQLCSLHRAYETRSQIWLSANFDMCKGDVVVWEQILYGYQRPTCSLSGADFKLLVRTDVYPFHYGYLFLLLIYHEYSCISHSIYAASEQFKMVPFFFLLELFTPASCS